MKYINIEITRMFCIKLKITNELKIIVNKKLIKRKKIEKSLIN